MVYLLLLLLLLFAVFVRVLLLMMLLLVWVWFAFFSSESWVTGTWYIPSGCVQAHLHAQFMMMSPNGDIFPVTDHLCREFTGPRWIHKGQWRGALLFSLICAWINGWVNNREASDLRRHRAHYDIAVMFALLTKFITYTCTFWRFELLVNHILSESSLWVGGDVVVPYIAGRVSQTWPAYPYRYLRTQRCWATYRDPPKDTWQRSTHAENTEGTRTIVPIVAARY